jgi:hypothetical protein
MHNFTGDWGPSREAGQHELVCFPQAVAEEDQPVDKESLYSSRLASGKENHLQA